MTTEMEYIERLVSMINTQASINDGLLREVNRLIDRCNQLEKTIERLENGIIRNFSPHAN